MKSKWHANMQAHVIHAAKNIILHSLLTSNDYEQHATIKAVQGKMTATAVWPLLHK